MLAFYVGCLVGSAVTICTLILMAANEIKGH